MLGDFTQDDAMQATNKAGTSKAVKADKDNVSPAAVVASILHLKTSSSKKCCSSDSDDDMTSSMCNTKHIWNNKSFDLQSFVEEDKIQCKKFQENILAEIKQGNEQMVKGVENTKAFQNDFLAILRGAYTCN